MRKAALDIGSNSILLVIADVEESKIDGIGDWLFYPRLGEEVRSKGCLKAERMADAMIVVGKVVEICQKNGVESINAAATAAIREADNGMQFAKDVQEKHGIEVELISGEEEARLTYLGAISGLENSCRVSVIDVGGGSSEVTIGEGKIIQSTISVPIGAIKLMEMFGKSPLLKTETEEFLSETLQPIADSARDYQLIGVGGTITTLAAIELGLLEYDEKLISEVAFSIDLLEWWIKKLQGMSVKEISQIPGLEPQRADIIEAGATIIWSFMKQSGAEAIRVSPRGLRYGLLLG